MKKILFFCAALAAWAPVSCDKDRTARPLPSRPVTCNVTIQGAPGTRATGTDYADESRVNSLQVFVFNGEDCEAHSGLKENTMSTVIPATSGERSVWAVVNVPEDLYEDGLTLPALKAKASALSDNRTGSFVMTGSATQELTDGCNVPVTVRRIVSRVSLRKISTSLKDYRKDYSVRIEGIGLVNVAGECPYFTDGTPSVWVNRLRHEDPAYDALLYDAVTGITVRNSVYQEDGTTLVTDNAYTGEHVFYPYPNAFPEEGTTPGFEDSWSPRGTLLVIEATLFQGPSDTEGIHGYYPVPLPALERNKTYLIEEICITRLPGDVPYKPIETGEAQVTVTVHEWETGLNLGTITL